VTAVGPQAEAASRQYPVEITVPNSELALKGGMVARVEIVYGVYEDVPLLPVDALIEDEGAFFYFVVDAGTAHRRRAVLGPRAGQSAALLEGGAPGDSVVVLGQARLIQDARVSVEEVRR
jgi:multidrug efflux pump subunit AcrA (membrane-fusion protein)